MTTRHLIMGCGALLVPVCGADALGAFAQAEYEHVFEFNDVLDTNPMGLAWDGTTYHVVTGGSRDGIRYARHDATGAVTQTFAPNFDFRSITASPSGSVFARAAGSTAFQRQQAPGIFGLEYFISGTGLTDPAQLLLHPSGNTLHTLLGDVLYTLDADTGALQSTLTLQGYGGLNSEFDLPGRDRFAITDDGEILTFAAGVVSLWDASGVRTGTATLIEADGSDSARTSFSYANGMVFVLNTPGALWRGYVLTVPAPASLALLVLTPMCLRRRR